MYSYGGTGLHSKIIMVIASEQIFAPHDDTTRFITLRFEFDHLTNSFRANLYLETIKLIFPKVDDFHAMARISRIRFEWH